jgi:hypothetical protein
MITTYCDVVFSKGVYIMSNMLEQAIIDAEALKEAAQKSAQETIIEHYADDIRSAVEKILEQDEMEFDLAGDDEAQLTVEEDTGDAVVEQLPSSVTADESEYVTLDLDQLEEMMAAEIEEEGDLDAAEMSSREELAEEVEDDIVELDENVIRALLEDEDVEVEELEEEATSDEDVETLEEAEEEDDDDPRDDAGGGHLDYKTAKDRPDFPYKEHKQLQDDNKSLLAEQKKFQKRIQLLEGKVEKYRTLINSMKDKLEEVNLSNAKLLYQNRVLDSISLNERQKDKIVETISNAKTVEETKIIFETLQSAVGSASTPKPKSLNEVVTKRSSAFLPRKEEKRTDPFIDRMKLLAGLKNN